jgi:hypothetical protein
MSDLEDRANRLLSLAMKYFERAECAESPLLAAQFRAMGSQYRDTAILMVEGGQPVSASATKVSKPRSQTAARRAIIGRRSSWPLGYS